MKFYNTLDEYKDKDITIYVDMDGVIAEYDIGNFDYNTIRPLKSNIKRVEELIKKDNIKVKILTVCKTDKIVEEKIDWLKRNMSFFDINDVIFISKEQEEYKKVESQELKSNYLKEHMDSTINILVDDDNSIIKYVRKNNKDLIVFQVSSWID